MIYANHNFRDNFLKTIKSKDMNLTRELVVSEVGKVIQSRPFQVRQLISGCGIKITTNASIRQIVSVVNFNMARNACLRKGIAQLVIDNQLPYKGNGKTMKSGYLNQNGIDVTGGDIADVFGDTLNTFWNIREGNKNRENDQLNREHEYQLALMQQDLMLKQMEMNNQLPPQIITAGPNTGNKTIMYILLGLGAVGIVAVILSRRNK